MVRAPSRPMLKSGPDSEYKEKIDYCFFSLLFSNYHVSSTIWFLDFLQKKIQIALLTLKCLPYTDLINPPVLEIRKNVPTLLYYSSITPTLFVFNFFLLSESISSKNLAHWPIFGAVFRIYI